MIKNFEIKIPAIFICKNIKKDNNTYTFDIHIKFGKNKSKMQYWNHKIKAKNLTELKIKLQKYFNTEFADIRFYLNP